MSIPMGVFKENEIAPQDNQKWLVNGSSGYLRSVTLDLSTFTKDEYFSTTDKEATVGYVKSGIPLARITSTGLYGPYDKDASDGRQLQVAGFLDTLFKVEYTRTGMKATANAASMRYSCHINNDELPVKLDKTTKTEGYVTNVPDSGEVYVFPTVNQAAAV